MARLAAACFCVVLVLFGCKSVTLQTPPPIQPSGLARELVRQAIEYGSARAGWTTRYDEASGAIEATYVIHVHTVVVRIRYDSDSVDFRYVTSVNLGCVPEGDTCHRIHKSYNAWVGGLRDAIAHAMQLPLAEIRKVKVDEVEPGPSYALIGPLFVTDGKGCGFTGPKANFERALWQLRERAAEMGASYVRVVSVIAPHMTAANCFNDRFTISAIAYRGSVAAPAEPTDLSGIVVSSGSGIVVDESGSILTNAHVVAGCRRIRTRCDEKLVALEVVDVDEANDLALLESRSTCGAAAVFRDGDTIQPGDEVLAVGFPLHGQLSDTPSVSSGIVSNALGPGNDPRLFQFTAPIQPGNSGGPLVDTSGLVAGVVVATLTSAKFPVEAQALPQNVNFAIRADLAQSLLASNGIEYRKHHPAARKTTSELVQSTSSIVRSVQCLD